MTRTFLSALLVLAVALAPWLPAASHGVATPGETSLLPTPPIASGPLSGSVDHSTGIVTADLLDNTGTVIGNVFLILNSNGTTVGFLSLLPSTNVPAVGFYQASGNTGYLLAKAFVAPLDRYSIELKYSPDGSLVGGWQQF